MNRSSILIALCFLAIGGVTVWGHTHELFYPTGLGHVLEVFWGKLMALDFAASLLLIGFWIGLLHPPEQRFTRGIPWTIAVLALGTPAALLFFLIRSRRYPAARDLFLKSDLPLSSSDATPATS